MFWLCRAAEFFDGVFGDLHSVELWVAWEVEEPDGDGGVECLCRFEFERDDVAGLCASSWLACGNGLLLLLVGGGREGREVRGRRGGEFLECEVSGLESGDVEVRDDGCRPGFGGFVGSGFVRVCVGGCAQLFGELVCPAGSASVRDDVEVGVECGGGVECLVWVGVCGVPDDDAEVVCWCCGFCYGDGCEWVAEGSVDETCVEEGCGCECGCGDCDVSLYSTASG